MNGPWGRVIPRRIRGGLTRLRGRPEMVSALGRSEVSFLREFIGIPELEASLGRGEPVAARRVLLAHYASRRSPAWPDFPTRMSEAGALRDEELICQAQRLLEHRFTFAGQPEVRFGARIDWRHNPTADPRARWTRELHRHRWWAVLAKAYQRTGDERYASEWVDVMCDWIRGNPPPPHKREGDVAWTLMGVGMRCLIWPSAFSIFYGARSFTDDAKLLMLRSLFDHGQFLHLFHTHYNHLLRESNGLAYLSVYFPEFRRSGQWLRIALERLEGELRGQVYEDGTHIEVSTGYQWLAIEEFEGTAEILEAAGTAFSAMDLDARLGDMYRVLAAIIRPDGRFPQINDGFMDPRDTLLARLARAGHHRGQEELVYLGTRGAQGRPPAWCSRGMEDAGLYVMRSDWGADARYLLFDCGPFGGPHGHEDKLSVEICAYGQAFIVDPGSYTYHADDPYRDYFAGSRGHNTLVPAALSQVRRWGPDARQISTKITADTGAWLSREAFDYVEGQYTGPYGAFRFRGRPAGEPLVEGVRHTRQILFVKPDYWFMVDRVESPVPRDFELLFHTAPGIEARVEADGRVRLLASSSGAVLDLVPAGRAPDRVELVCGEESPIQGWYSNGRAAHKVPATAVIMRFEAISQARIGLLLYPHRGADETTVLVQPLEVGDAAACCVESTTGKDYLMVDNRGHWKKMGPHRSCAKVAGLRTDLEGRVLTSFEWSPERGDAP